MTDDPKEIVRRAAEHAGIPLTQEQVTALAQTLPSLRLGIEALGKLELGEREPAFGFRPPKG